MAKIGKFNFSGITKIKIPMLDSDFMGGKSLENIKTYLPFILTKHRENRRKIDYLYNYFLGIQDIKDKKRLYNKDSKNNNIVTENHAFRQVTFKAAYITSEKRDYSHKSDSDTDDMTYLDRYFTDCGYFAKDTTLKEWIYSTGIGCTYTSPRTDIIVEEKGKYRYLTPEEGFNINSDAPFEFNVLDPRDNFIVYSSVMGENPLFCVSLVAQENDNATFPSEYNYKYKLFIETRYARYVAECNKDFGLIGELKFEVEKAFVDMPMCEHSINDARLGIVELNRDLFNSINTLTSNITDIVVDGANVIMVFKNTDIDQSTIADMRNKGAIILKDAEGTQSNSEAKLETVTLEINFDGLNSFYEERLSQAYDIAGVPMASGQVTSGGDTGQARMLGGGWSNAYTIAKKDVNMLLKGDYTILKTILKICKSTPNCPVNDISASQIDIKYQMNQSDNLLVKAQSIAQLYEVNMPKEEILKQTGLFSDVCTVAKKWEKEDHRVRTTPNYENPTSVNAI
jgi:SPP1 family phage portal protein